LYTDIGQGRADIVEFEGLDHRNDQFHGNGLLGNSLFAVTAEVYQ
jgi:hypothetical protein